MNRTAVPRVRNDLALSEVDDEFIVYNPATDRTALLNPTAALVFDYCDGSRTLEEIAGKVAAFFKIERETVLPDVQAALKELTTKGFLELEPEKSGESTPPL